MGRFECEQRRVIESCSPLLHHSRNQKTTRQAAEGDQRHTRIPKKIARAERKRARRFRQAAEKFRGILEGNNGLENSVSKKDLRYIGDALRIVNPKGLQAGPIETLRTLSIIEKITHKSPGNSLTTEMGHIFIRSLGRIIVSESVCRGLEKSITCLQERGIKIEVLSPPNLRETIDFPASLN